MIVDDGVDGGVDIAQGVAHQLALGNHLVQDHAALLRQTVKVGMPKIFSWFIMHSYEITSLN